MMRFWLMTLAILATSWLSAAEADVLPFDKGKQAYAEKKYSEAISIFEHEIESQKDNPSLYFNLGLSYKAEKDFPRAIWAFEKVLKLQPNDSEARTLIELCNTELEINSWQSELSPTESNLFSFGSNTWSIAAIIFSVIAALILVRMRQVKSLTQKKLQLSGVLVSILLSGTSLYIAYECSTFERSHEFAVVIESEIPIYLSGKLTEMEPTSMHLPAGTKVRILNWEEDGRIEVETTKGQKVYLEEGLVRI